MMLFLSTLGIVCLVNEVKAASLSSKIQARSRPQAKLDFFGPDDDDEAFLQLSSTARNKTVDFVKLDQAAQEDFVRRCEVVVTVSDDKFLPVKPLDRFCETTDAAVECRLKVGMRLKETHARDGDMGQFCIAVYDWFQGKYGGKCTKQCRKLQCKSTCLWLEAKKKSNSENLEIKEEMQEAEKALDYIKELGKKVEAKKGQERKNLFTIKMTKVKVQRAKDALAREEKNKKDSEAKKAKVDGSVAKLEKAIQEADDKLVKMDDDIMKRKFELDKNMQTMDAEARSIKRLLDKAEAAKKEEASIKAQADKVDAEIEKVTAGKKAREKQLKADQDSAGKQDVVLKDAVAKLKKAIQTLDEYKKKDSMLISIDEDNLPDKWKEAALKAINGDYKKDKNVPNLIELVQNQLNRAKAADKIKADLDDKISDAKLEIKQNKADIADLDKELGTLEKEELDTGKEAATYMGEAKKAQKKLDKFKADSIDKKKKELADARAAQEKETASRKKAVKTLKFMEALQTETNSKAVMANGAVGQAKMALSSMESNLKGAEGALATTQKDKKALESEEKAKKAALKKKEDAMTTRIKAFKKVEKDLFMKRPEIVRQFSLEP